MINLKVQELYNIVKDKLYVDSPVYSGSLKNHIGAIQQINIGDNMVQIVINAPFYDMKEFQATKQIKYTGEVINGEVGYAYHLNRFGTRKTPKYWVNRSINNACLMFAKSLGDNVEVINKLPL